MAKDVRKAVIAILRANASLIAAGVGNQISSQYAPATFSGIWITVKKVSGQEESAHSGNQFLSRPRYQFDVSSTNKALVDQVANILINEFNGATYTSGSTSVTFFHESDEESWEEAPRIYTASVDLTLMVETA